MRRHSLTFQSKKQSTYFNFAKCRFFILQSANFISQSTDFISQSTGFILQKYRIYIWQSTYFISNVQIFHFAKCRFHFAKYRFYFAKYRFHFAKVQIFHFANYRFFISLSTDFTLQSINFIKLCFILQSTKSQKAKTRLSVISWSARVRVGSRAAIYKQPSPIEKVNCYRNWKHLQ